MNFHGKFGLGIPSLISFCYEFPEIPSLYKIVLGIPRNSKCVVTNKHPTIMLANTQTFSEIPRNFK